MKRLTIVPLLMLVAGASLVGCAPKQEEPSKTAAPTKAAPAANPQKPGASAVDEAVTAPPGVQTGTP